MSEGMNPKKKCLAWYEKNVLAAVKVGLFYRPRGNLSTGKKANLT